MERGREISEIRNKKIQWLTKYKNNSRNSSKPACRQAGMNILVCNNISSKLKIYASEIGYYSYTNRCKAFPTKAKNNEKPPYFHSIKMKF